MRIRTNQKGAKMRGKKSWHEPDWFHYVYSRSSATHGKKTPAVALMTDEGCACNQNHWKFSTRKQIRDFTRKENPREPIYSWRTCVGVDAYLQNYYITKTVMSIHCWFSICHVQWNLCNSIYIRKLRRRGSPGTMGENHRKLTCDICSLQKWKNWHLVM